MLVCIHIYGRVYIYVYRFVCLCVYPFADTCALCCKLRLVCFEGCLQLHTWEDEKMKKKMKKMKKKMKKMKKKI